MNSIWFHAIAKRGHWATIKPLDDQTRVRLCWLDTQRGKFNLRDLSRSDEHRGIVLTPKPWKLFENRLKIYCFKNKTRWRNCLVQNIVVSRYMCVGEGTSSVLANVFRLAYVQRVTMRHYDGLHVFSNTIIWIYHETNQPGRVKCRIVTDKARTKKQWCHAIC